MRRGKSPRQHNAHVVAWQLMRMARKQSAEPLTCAVLRASDWAPSIGHGHDWPTTRNPAYKRAKAIHSEESLMLKIVAIAVVSSLSFFSPTVSDAQESVADQSTSATETKAVETVALPMPAPERWAADGYEDR
jgi:hypothetical protein